MDLIEEEIIVEDAPVEKESDVDKFIRDLELTAVDDFVSDLIIYYTYCLWRPLNRVNRVKFFRIFSKIFTGKIKSGESGYLLDNSHGIFDTSIENKFAARKFLRLSRRQREFKKRKKTNKKK